MVTLSMTIMSWDAQGAEQLTLAGAIDAALRSNPQIQVARYQLEAAESGVTHARSGLLPQIDLVETYNYTNSPLWAFGTKLNQGAIESSDFNPDRLNEPDAIGNWNTALTLSWNLFDGGRTWKGLDQSKQFREAATLMVKRSEQQIIAMTARAYVGALLAAENRLVVQQSLDTARAHLKVVGDRFSGGLAVKSDLLRAQVRIAELEQQLFEADSQVQVAQAMLKAAMGRSDDIALVLTNSLKRCIPTKGNLEHWLTTATDQRPDLKQLNIQETTALSEIDRAKSGHWPQLALKGSYELNSEDFSDVADNYTIGAMLSINLYSGQRISGQSAAAKALAAKATSMRNGLALGVRVDVQRAFYQAQSAWKRIQVAQDSVAQADEGLRIVANRYESGLLTLVTLLDAQVALQQAKTQHFKAMHDYKLARINLALASGTIDREFN